ALALTLLLWATSAAAQGASKAEAQTATDLKRACDKGHLDACTNLGIAYMEGQGVKADPKQALALLEKSCKKDDAKGCFNLGLAHEMGRTGQKVPQKA